MALKDQREIGTGGGLAGAAHSGISAIASVVYGSVCIGIETQIVQPDQSASQNDSFVFLS